MTWGCMRSISLTAAMSRPGRITSFSEATFGRYFVVVERVSLKIRLAMNQEIFRFIL